MSRDVEPHAPAVAITDRRAPRQESGPGLAPHVNRRWVFRRKDLRPRADGDLRSLLGRVELQRTRRKNYRPPWKSTTQTIATAHQPSRPGAARHLTTGPGVRIGSGRHASPRPSSASLFAFSVAAHPARGRALIGATGSQASIARTIRGGPDHRGSLSPGVPTPRRRNFFLTSSATPPQGSCPWQAIGASRCPQPDSSGVIPAPGRLAFRSAVKAGGSSPSGRSSSSRSGAAAVARGPASISHAQRPATRCRSPSRPGRACSRHKSTRAMPKANRRLW